MLCARRRQQQSDQKLATSARKAARCYAHEPIVRALARMYNCAIVHLRRRRRWGRAGVCRTRDALHMELVYDDASYTRNSSIAYITQLHEGGAIVYTLHFDSKRSGAALSSKAHQAHLSGRGLPVRMRIRMRMRVRSLGLIGRLIERQSD